MMKDVISFSGGLGSIVSSLVAHEQRLDALLVFADTRVEHVDVYRSIEQVVKATGLEFVWLRDGRTPWDVFIDERFIGNSRIAPCSKLLKTRPVKAFIRERFQPDEVRLNLGMDLSEMDRIERAQKVWAPYQVSSVLIRHKVYRPEWPAILQRYGIDTPRLYADGFPHNNCGGACVRAGLAQWRTLLERQPAIYAANEAEEARAIAAIGPTAKPFLSRSVKGDTEYMTLARFRELCEAGAIKVNPYDFGGCGCFIDDEPTAAQVVGAALAEVG